MNLEQVKKRVAEISKSTATKHPKVLVAELCSVVAALVVEIERIDKKAPVVLNPTPDPVIPDSGKDTKWRKRTDDTPVRRSPPLQKPDETTRRFNAGDAT